MSYFNNKKGFTLIELIIVVVIIAILATFGLSSYNKIQDQSRAAKIVSDFKIIEKALKSYKAANGRYINEDYQCLDGTQCTTTNNEMSALDCLGNGTQRDEPEISRSLVYISPNGYLDTVPRDPWGREYAYDFDEDSWSTSNTAGGVNIMLFWCDDDRERYIRIMPIIDKLIDNSDSLGTNGKFYWTTVSASDTSPSTPQGEMWYTVAPNGFN